MLFRSHPAMEEHELRFIELEETAGLGYAQTIRAKADQEGKAFHLFQGSTRLLRALLAGAWDPEEFLVVPPGAGIVPIYDHERVIEAR